MERSVNSCDIISKLAAFGMYPVLEDILMFYIPIQSVLMMCQVSFSSNLYFFKLASSRRFLDLGDQPSTLIMSGSGTVQN